MKRIIGLFAVALVLVSATAFAATTTTYKVQKGDTWESIAVKVGTTTQALIDLNQPEQGDRINIPAPVVVTPPPPVDVCSNIAGVQTTIPAGFQLVNGLCVPIVVTPPPTASSTEIVLNNVYTTGYGYPDNTPANSAAISNGVIHKTAGGTGTFTDPVTLAVGHSMATGKDVLDFPAGTKFYIPNLRKYFIVEDTCGDGSKPQNAPCHNVSTAPNSTSLWLDLWVGGVGSSAGGTIACENAITPNNTSQLRTVIENPASNYAVVSGQIYNGTCQAQFGNATTTAQ